MTSSLRLSKSCGHKERFLTASLTLNLFHSDSMYGLAAAVFSKDVTTAISTAHKLKAGTVW